MLNYGCAIVGLPLMLGLTWICVSLGRYALAIFAAIMGGVALLMIGPSRPRRLDPLAPPTELLPQSRQTVE